MKCRMPNQMKRGPNTSQLPIDTRAAAAATSAQRRRKSTRPGLNDMRSTRLTPTSSRNCVTIAVRHPTQGWSRVIRSVTQPKWLRS